MTSPRTRDWWPAVRQAVTEIDSRCDGVLPWQKQYVDIFGDRESLLEALRYYWQLEVADRPDLLQDAEAHRGLRLILFTSRIPDPAGQPDATPA
jgi:hypothetical protein